MEPIDEYTDDIQGEYERNKDDIQEEYERNKAVQERKLWHLLCFCYIGFLFRLIEELKEEHQLEDYSVS